MDLFDSVSVASVVRANRLQTFQLRLQLRRVITWRTPTNRRNYPAALREPEQNGPWPLPKARPISCNDSPAFQRLHMSARCSAESLFRFPRARNTTFRKIIPMRWCCIDQLNRQCATATTIPPIVKVVQRTLFGCGVSLPRTFLTVSRVRSCKPFINSGVRER
jgi:hypothetical protein